MQVIFAFLSYANESEPREPKNYEEAIRGYNAPHWQISMEEEYHALQENNIWKVVRPLRGQKVLQGK